MIPYLMAHAGHLLGAAMLTTVVYGLLPPRKGDAQ